MEYYAVRKNNIDDNELYHYGVLGMKWGVRRNRQSRAQKDARKLANAAGRHYEHLNRYNIDKDFGLDIYQPELMKQRMRGLNKERQQVDKLVKKLDKKYGSVSATPEVAKNGYIVKSVESSITKLDRHGRVTNVAKSYSPVDHHQYREAEEWRKKAMPIMAKYDKKMKAAKTEDERFWLEAEREDELDNITVKNYEKR